MSWQSLLSVIAASIGFVSGIWFCYGAAFIDPRRIVQAADNSWKADTDTSGALISQSAEYLAGGLLLVFAFGIQVAAALAPSTNIQLTYPVLLSGWVVVPSTALLSLLVSYPLYVCRKKLLAKKALQLIAKGQ